MIPAPAEYDPVARLRAGDLGALETLVPRYEHRLYRYLLRITNDPALAQDLFHETWLRVAERIARFDPRRSFDTWLFSVAHNIAVDSLRRVRTQPFDADPVEQPAVLRKLVDRERTDAVREAIEQLPDAAREVISLRFEEDMKLEEIAATTGAPLASVKSRLRRALIRLREVLHADPRA